MSLRIAWAPVLAPYVLLSGGSCEAQTPIPHCVGAFCLGQREAEVRRIAHLEWLHPCPECGDAEGTAFVEGRYVGNASAFTLVTQETLDSTGLDVEVRKGTVVGMALPIEQVKASATRPRIDSLYGPPATDSLFPNGVGLVEWKSGGAVLRLYYVGVMSREFDPRLQPGDVLSLWLADARWDGP